MYINCIFGTPKNFFHILIDSFDSLIFLFNRIRGFIGDGTMLAIGNDVWLILAKVTRDSLSFHIGFDASRFSFISSVC